MSQHLSDLIRKYRSGVAKNSYQGNDKKVLFVCTMGILRSATASRMYGSKYNTRAAGVDPEALVLLSDILVMWADEIIFVSDETHMDAKSVLKDEDLLYECLPKIMVLDIPDRYPHMDPRLIAEFERQYEPL